MGEYLGLEIETDTPSPAFLCSTHCDAETFLILQLLLAKDTQGQAKRGSEHLMEL